MSPELTPHQLAQQWLDITVERFAANMRRLRIGKTGQLLASFRKEVIAAAGADRLRLRLSYALYGQFVDMGVGRGMGAGLRRGDDGYDRIRNTRGRLRRQQRLVDAPDPLLLERHRVHGRHLRLRPRRRLRQHEPRQAQRQSRRHGGPTNDPLTAYGQDLLLVD